MQSEEGYLKVHVMIRNNIQFWNNKKEEIEKKFAYCFRSKLQSEVWNIQKHITELEMELDASLKRLDEWRKKQPQT